MSLFEFVTVMISMILALSFGQMLQSAAYFAKTEREIIPYRPYALWIASIVLTVLNHWWSLWDLQSINWSYPSFVYILIAPTLISYAISLLAPNTAGTGTIDIPTQFEKIRKLFSKVMFTYVAIMWFDGPLLAGQNAFGFVGLMHIPVLIGVAVPWFTGNKLANTIAPLINILLIMFIMAIRFMAA